MTMKNRIDGIKEEIQEQINSLYDMRVVLDSLKVLLNYKETGKPYSEEDDFY